MTLDGSKQRGKAFEWKERRMGTNDYLEMPIVKVLEFERWLTFWMLMVLLQTVNYPNEQKQVPMDQ